MGKHLTPIILIILAIGIFFTVTKTKLDDLKVIRAVNAQYQSAIKNAKQLIKVRDDVLETYNKITDDDRERLDKMLPNNVDNVRLIIDIDDIASRHGFTLRNVKTSAATDGTKSTAQSSAPAQVQSGSINQYNTVTLSFNVTSTYEKFIDFLRDLEQSLRIIDISKISLSASDNGVYDYGVEIKTYWLKQ
jgi:Tfp pilus assembly protein PilO